MSWGPTVQVRANRGRFDTEGGEKLLSLSGQSRPATGNIYAKNEPDSFMSVAEIQRRKVALSDQSRYHG